MALGDTKLAQECSESVHENGAFYRSREVIVSEVDAAHAVFFAGIRELVELRRTSRYTAPEKIIDLQTNLLRLTEMIEVREQSVAEYNGLADVSHSATD